MPLYEYQCDACGHRFEKIQKFSDAREDTCPKCGGTVQKLVSSPAIQFKGSGFYITDYAKKSSTDSANRKADKGEGGKGDTAQGDSAKGDSAKADTTKSTESSSTKTTDSTSSSSSSSSSSKD